MVYCMSVIIQNCCSAVVEKNWNDFFKSSDTHEWTRCILSHIPEINFYWGGYLTSDKIHHFMF